MTAPLESEDQARNLPAVRAVYSITGHGEQWRQDRRAAMRAITSGACDEAGVTPGAYETEFLDWLSFLAEPQQLGALANLLRRCCEAGKTARDDSEAVRLLEEALHLYQDGEQAPGGTETLRDWARKTEAFLRRYRGIAEEPGPVQ